MTDEARLMHTIRTAEFALIEAGLFLDTHPTDQNALDYYAQYRQIYDNAVSTYIAAYGPLTPYQNTGNHWKWVDAPCPWERAANH